MADQDPAAAAQPQIKMQILAQFTRDLSFENILAQKPIEAQVQPDVQVQVALDGKKRTVENQYDVIAKFTVTSKNKDSDDLLFVIELEYSGVFLIEGVPDEQLHPFLMIECPRMLFPYIRRIISDVSRDGGFPPLNVDNIDFVQLYRQTMAQRAEAAKAGNGDAPVN